MTNLFVNIVYENDCELRNLKNTVMTRLVTVILPLIYESTYQGRLIRSRVEGGVDDDPSMQKLMDSINDEGLMTPIVVRKINEKYEIIDGHRRFEAFKRLNKGSIECLVAEYDEKQAQAFSIIGNLHRKNLSTIEQAIAFKKILDSGAFRDVKELSKTLAKHETYVGDVLNTLNMDQRIIDDLAQNRTTDDVRLLRAIRRIEKAVDNTSDKQWELYQKFKDEHLTRNDIIKEVKSAFSPAPEYKIEGSGRKFTVSLKKNLSQENQRILSDFIEEKLRELFPEDTAEDSEPTDA